jgi:AraC-like DNA-binding protein
MAPFWRMYLVRDEGGFIRLGKETFELTQGATVIIPPMTDVSSFNEKPFRKFFCHFQIEKLESELKKDVYFCETPQNLKDSAEKILSEKVSLLHTNILGMNLIAMALNSIPEKNWTRTESDPRIEKAINMMKKSLAVSNNKLAQAAGMAENSFIRFFKTQKGVAPQKYLNYMRIEKACELLLHTDKTIEMIAEECGFWDRNHFSMQFKKHIKHPPASYRRIFRYWN